jgi:type I restriction enzyme, S subunit
VKDGTHDTPGYVMPSENSFPLITSKDIKNGRIDFSDAKHISADDHIKANQRSDVVFDDVIMPMIGTVGGAAIVKSEKRFSIKNVALFKTSPKAMNIQYFCYLIDSHYISLQFDLLSRGGVQGFVSLDVLRNLSVFKLDDQEQAAIANYIEDSTLKIDATISKIETEIELLHEYRTALISEAVSGKIDVREVN